MFAIHHLPTGIARNEGVVLCNPFGQEAIRCHRLFKVLAEQLSRQGFHVLRFDYFATGDSGGDDHEADLDGWCADLRCADEALRTRCGVAQVSWCGLRLGATIAALASRQARSPVRRIVMWDPIIDGTEYLTEMVSAHLAARRDSFGARWVFDPTIWQRATAEARDEVLGFAVPPMLRARLNALSAPQLAAMHTSHVAVLARTGLPGLNALRHELSGLNLQVSVNMIDTSINWASNEASDSSIAPAQALKALLGFFEEPA